LTRKEGRVREGLEREENELEWDGPAALLAAAADAESYEVVGAGVVDAAGAAVVLTGAADVAAGTSASWLSTFLADDDASCDDDALDDEPSWATTPAAATTPALASFERVSWMGSMPTSASPPSARNADLEKVVKAVRSEPSTTVTVTLAPVAGLVA